nr:glycosyltransferase [Sphingomonas sp. BT553]
MVCSPIPVVRVGSAWHTLDLWAHDINAQADVADITLRCAAVDTTSDALAPLAPGIALVTEDDDLASVIPQTDFIQIPGNAGWLTSRPYLPIVQWAKRFGKPVFLGISSNRARTYTMNAKGKSLFARTKALLQFVDIRMTQLFLASRCAGVFVVGEGLRKLVWPVARDVHVGVASWVDADDIAPPRADHDRPLRVCMAGRLEPMKGFHIGIDAFALAGQERFASLTIIGRGAEQDALARQAEQGQLADFAILPPVGYPTAFFHFLDNQDIVLMTNLNDEQPRLIFDAISRGCIPLCPDTPPYRALGLDTRILYEQGSAASLADRLRSLADPALRRQVGHVIAAKATTYTVHTMHRARLDWMAEIAARR